MGKRHLDLEVSAGGIVFRRTVEQGTRYLLIKDSYDNWGFPKGHLEDGETPAEAAGRETGEETGLGGLVLQGPIRVIDWHFRFRGRHIHKYCHFFLFESIEGDPCPQGDEGITACEWHSLDHALETLSYDNARGVLKRAGEMVRTLVASGAGRPRAGSTPPPLRSERARRRRLAREPRGGARAQAHVATGLGPRGRMPDRVGTSTGARDPPGGRDRAGADAGAHG